MEISEFKQNSCEGLKRFFFQEDDGIYYLSHASILVSLNKKNYLFDPVLAKPPHLGSWLFYPEMKADACLLDVDGVFVSHQHQDHFDVDFLKLLPAETKIYIVSGRPQFNNMLDEKGIPFIEVPENEVYDLGSGVTCLGINHEYNGIDSSITISNGKFTVYHGNDCFVSNEKLKIVKNIYPMINVACVPFAYVHWYPFLLDDVEDEWKRNEARKLINKYLDYGLSQIEYIRPEIAIPFGANMFYFDDVDSDHNSAVVSPLDFKDYAIDTEFPYEESILPLFAGDYILSLDSDNDRRLVVHTNNLCREELMRGLKEYIDYINIIGTGFDSESIENINLSDISETGFISSRMSNTNVSHQHHIIISNSDHPEIGYVAIDLDSGTVNRVLEFDGNISHHWFKLSDLAYKAYFSQKYSFNEIVASSRFRLSRNPNEYNLDVLRIVNNVL